MKNRLAFIALFLSAPCAFSASGFSFTGTFTSDDQVQLFDFSVLNTGTVTLRSLGYAGGTSAAATVIPAGGFDSLFTLFQADGTQIGYFDDDPGCAHTGFRNGGCLDAYYSNTLQAGSYILAVTEYPNFPNGDLSDGFAQAGQGNFTATTAPMVCAVFCDSAGNASDGNFAVDFLSVDSASLASAPEPAAATLMGSGLFCLALGLRRRRPARSSGGPK